MGNSIRRLGVGAAALLFFALGLPASSNAQPSASLEEVRARIDGRMIVLDQTPRPSYRFGAWDSYGLVRVNFDGASASGRCETGIFSTLRQLLVRNTKSAGIAVRISTSQSGSGVSDAGGDPPGDAPRGAFGPLPRDRVTIYAANLLRVSSEERRGRNCQSQINTAGGATALLDLRGQARPVFVEFIVWSSSELSTGFITHNAIGLYSTKALAPLTRGEVQNLANGFVAEFSRANTSVLQTQLSFEATPRVYGVSLVFAEGDQLAGAGRIDIDLETTRSVFLPFGNEAPNFANASAADVMNTPIGAATVSRAVADAANFADFVRVRATDTDLSKFNQGCTAIQNRVSEIGLTGVDQYVATWGAIRQHPGYQEDPLHFASTDCVRQVRGELTRRLGDAQPRPELAESAPPRVPDAAAMGAFMDTELRPFLRLEPDERTSASWAKIFSADATVRASQRITPPLIQDNAIIGRFGRIGCYAFTTWRPDFADTMNGSRVEGIIEVRDGGEAYFRGIFKPAAGAEGIRLSEFRFDSIVSDNARARILDNHGDGCANGTWRPALLYGPG